MAKDAICCPSCGINLKVLLEPKGREAQAGVKEVKKTAVQRIVEAYKVSKKVDMMNKEWDRANFSRYTRAAKSLLDRFKGDVDSAAAYLFVRGGYFDEKHLDWTLETIAKNAWDNAGMAKMVESEQEGPIPVETEGPRMKGGYVTPRQISHQEPEAYD